MRLSILGAAREATGSCFLVETINTRFLVDCGLVQGGIDQSARNQKPFEFEPSSIDFVLLTAAHINHSGLLPKLTRAGFPGPIYATSATIDLLGVILPGSAHIEEDESTRGHQGKGSASAPPLYTLQDASACLRQVAAVNYDQEFAPRETVHCRFRDSGHILGSAIIEIWITEYGFPTKLVFTGPLGQPGRPLAGNSTAIEDADILVIESTYGDRRHRKSTTIEREMISIVDKALPEGNVIIPGYTVGRAQQLIYQLHRLVAQKRLDPPRIFVDSPMAKEAVGIIRKQVRQFPEMSSDRAVDLDLPYLHFAASEAESQALSETGSGAIIIAPNGTCEGGRILQHLRRNLSRCECSVMFTEFQPEGTLGRNLVDGARHVRMFGEDIEVRASIFSVNGLSAHADQTALLNWAAGFRRPPAQTFVVHGEPLAAQALADTLSHIFNWHTIVPERGQKVRWPDFLSIP